MRKIKNFIKELTFIFYNYKTTIMGGLVISVAVIFGMNGQVELAMGFLTAGIGLLSAKDYDKK